MFSTKRKFGNLGEDIACRFLVKQGFKIIDRNYLKKCGEIDIITEKENVIHFIEVKSVSCEKLSSTDNRAHLDDKYRPEDNLHKWKLNRLSNTIQIYLADKHVSDETEWVFDVIIVYIDKIRLISRVNFIENIIL